MQFIDSNLEKQTWISQIGPSINPVPADAFISTLLPSGVLKVTNASTKAFGGGLVSCKRPVPIFGNVAEWYVSMSTDVYIPASEFFSLGRLELDIKCAFTSAPSPTSPIANIFNGSGQFNVSDAQWQVDPSGNAWVDTGFKPNVVPDQWMSITSKFLFDVANGKMSFLNVWLGTPSGALLYTMPAALSNLPLQVSNWMAGTAIQEQTEVLNPGSVTTLYRNIQTIFSDQPL